MPIQGQCGGRSTGPRLPRKAAMRGLCGSPEGRALLWGLMTRRRRTSVSTTLSRNGSRKGRAEPGMKASKKEEGHLVGRSAGAGDLQGPSTGGDCSDPGRGVLRLSPTCSPSTASSRHSRVLLAGAARLRGKDSTPQGPLPLWSSPVTLSCFFSLFPTGRPARGFHQSLACSGPEYLDCPCSCALLSLLGSIWDLLQGRQGADGTLSWTGLSSQGSGAGCWQRCVENASLCD